MIELVLSLAIGLAVPIGLLVGRRAFVAASERRYRPRPANHPLPARAMAMPAPPRRVAIPVIAEPEAIAISTVGRGRRAEAPAGPAPIAGTSSTAQPASVSRPSTSGSSRTSRRWPKVRRQAVDLTRQPGTPVEPISDHVHLRAGRYPGSSDVVADRPVTLDRVPPWLATDTPECPGCAASRSKGANFCARCGRPIEHFATEQRGAAKRS